MTAQKQMFSLRLDPSLHRALNACAGVRGVALNDLLVGWIEEAWKKAPENEAITAAQQATANKSVQEKTSPRPTQAPAKKGATKKKG